MDIDQVRAFVRDNHHAVLVTTRRDGGAQTSPVAVAVDDDGSLVVSTREGAIKTANIRRSPRAYLCVFTDRFFGPWVQAEGEVEVESLPDAMAALERYYRAVAGEHPNWEEYRQAMVQERRVLLRMRVDRVGPNRQG